MSALSIAVVTGGRSTQQAAAADAPLVAALERAGAHVERPSWRDDTDWNRFDGAIVRSTWDYSDDRDAFVAWAVAVEATTVLWNPADVLRWNTHKGHLMELEERGAPVVPTAWLGRGDVVDLAALRAARGWGPVVCKPAVANGGDGLRVAGDDPTGDQAHLEELLAAGDVLVQPLLGRVATEGETSVVVIDGEVSHLIRKLPAPGEVRVQNHRGGAYERVEITGDDAEAAALALWVVEATGQELLYARVDLLRADDGTWQLGELELTEPDLYLRFAPQAADRLAAALLTRV